VRRRIPVTTLARTLFDVASEVSEEAFEAMIREAEYLHRFRIERLAGLFANFLAETDLPQPELNALLDLGDRMIEADCLWREQRLIAELDGRQAHLTRVAFEADRERDRRIQASGWRVVRITWRQLDQSKALYADLRRLLGASSQLSAK
jgi:hypothetical protein